MSIYKNSTTTAYHFPRVPVQSIVFLVVVLFFFWISSKLRFHLFVAKLRKKDSCFSCGWNCLRTKICVLVAVGCCCWCMYKIYKYCVQNLLCQFVLHVISLFSQCPTSPLSLTQNQIHVFTSFSFSPFHWFCACSHPLVVYFYCI